MMKSKFLIVLAALLTLMTLFVTVPGALAQDGEPGTNDEMSSPPEEALPSPLPAGDKTLGIGDRFFTGFSRDVTPATGILAIAVTDDFESHSDVAYGNSVYGIAYDYDGHIRVAFFNQNGHIISDTEISTGSENHRPAIAFEGTSNLFVVAYHYEFDDGDIDIFARAVGPFSGAVGSETNLTISSKDDEAYPDLDCNHDDASCLVAFSFDDGTDQYIQGRFVDVTSAGISTISGGPFRVSSTDNKSTPYVAWGWKNDRYMVVYHGPGLGGLEHSYYTHVYETYQNTGNQYMFNSRYLYTSASVSQDTIATGIAYDPATEQFLTLVRYDFGGSGDYDVLMYITNADGGGYRGPITIADFGDYKETEGSISFLTTPWEARTNLGPDQVAISYRRSKGSGASEVSEIISTVITGNSSKNDPSYTIPIADDHVLLDDLSGFGIWVQSPAVAGSDGSGKYMGTWTQHIHGIATDDEDIKGMILRSGSDNNCYLPLIIK